MLKAQLQQDLTASLKSGDQLKRLVLGMMLTSVKNKEVSKRTKLSKTITEAAELEKQSQLTNEEVLEIIAGEAKQRKEAIEQFTQGGRTDLAQKEKDELAIILTYLPEQLSESEIRNEIKQIINTTGAQGLKDMGRVIGAVMAKLKGKADGGLVSQIVKQELAG